MNAATPGSAADRKVVLMRVLAVAEAKRLGLVPSHAEIRETTHWFRASFGLRSLESFAVWLEHAGLGLEHFEAMMLEFTQLTLVLQHHAQTIDARMRDHLAMHTVYAFQQPRNERNDVKRI